MPRGLASGSLHEITRIAAVLRLSRPAVPSMEDPVWLPLGVVAEDLAVSVVAEVVREEDPRIVRPDDAGVVDRFFLDVLPRPPAEQDDRGAAQFRLRKGRHIVPYA